MTVAQRIPVALLTGFLGSGKTTLINRLVRDPAFTDTAVIVNELGEIGLDHLLIEQADDNVVLLDSGCLCCALQGGLRETLADLFVRRVNGTVPRFARVIVETTGVADPGPIANALVADALARAEFRLASIAATVDALAGLRTLATQPEALKQVALADLLLITKADLADPAPLQTELAALNPSAVIARSDSNSFADLFPPAESIPRAQRWSMPLARHLRGVRTVSFVVDAPLTWASLAAWTASITERFGERMLRVKGLIDIDGRPIAIHGIGRYFHPPERLERWPSADHRSRVVCIGRNVDEAELHASFALLTEDQS